MNRNQKLVLDLVMGAGIPALILAFLSTPLGAPTAYVLAALVPVAWVMIDLFFITRRFNAITTAVGIMAVGNGALAFWFVDGVLYAFKDSLSLVLYALLLVVSALIGKPFLGALLSQSIGGDTDERRPLLHALFARPSVGRALATSTLLSGLAILVAAAGNFALNLWIVVAPFGTEAFNLQVAQVNALTRIALPLWTMLSFGGAIFWTMKSITSAVGLPLDTPLGSNEFWEALERPRSAEAA